MRHPKPRRRVDTVNFDHVSTFFESAPVDVQEAIDRQNLEDERLDLSMSLPSMCRRQSTARISKMRDSI